MSEEPSQAPFELIAYHPSTRARAFSRLRIVPSSRWREWMNATDERSANRCLPLLMANESGWVILNPEGFEVTWDGRNHPDGLRIERDGDGRARLEVASTFGYGILSFVLPILFRTPVGYDLLARGPANWPKDGITALEGLVECDWAVSTFTMNWKLTRPGHPVRFEADEPFCMIVPQRRGELESFAPSHRHASEDPDTLAGMKAFSTRRLDTHRQKFLAGYSEDFSEAWSSWERDYFRGFRPDGPRAPVHVTKRRLSPFED